MEKGKIFRLVLIPIVAGLIVTLIAQALMNRSKQTAAAPKVETVPVVVVASKEPVPARTKLVESQLAIKQIPKELAIGTEFADPKELVGKIAMVELLTGEIILQGRVVEEGKGSLPYRIPEGKRAVTIRMDEFNGVAGNLNVGDLIDLILFLPEKANDKDPTATRPASARIIYEGVPVLARGLAAQTAPNGAAASAKTEATLSSITLALSPEASTEVALAEQIGYLKMVLRPALNQPDAGSITIYETKYDKTGQ